MQDKWARWVLAGRFGDDPEQAKAWREHLLPVRDKVLA